MKKKGEKGPMKSLYACIEINKNINETGDRVTEKIEYYKTKDENEIDSILDKLVSNGVMCNFEDIVNDLMKNSICAY